MAVGLLASLAIPFITDLISKHGSTLAEKGIEKVTGIKLEGKSSITPEERKAIVDAEVRIRELDFKELELEYNQRNTEEVEKTKRWESDNKSEGSFNKNVRPSLVVYLVFICTVLAVFDGNIGSFDVEDSWVTLFTSLTITAVGGYFTLRTYEKRTGVHK